MARDTNFGHSTLKLHYHYSLAGSLCNENFKANLRYSYYGVYGRPLRDEELQKFIHLIFWNVNEW